MHQNLVSPWMREKTCTHPREEGEPMPLPRLRAAGLLWHRIGEVEVSQPQGEFLMPLAIPVHKLNERTFILTADLYWPLDMGAIGR